MAEGDVALADLESPEDQDLSVNPELNPDPIKDDLDMQRCIKDMGRHFMGLDKWVRRNEVIEARRQRFYWRNNQYIYWKSDAIGFIPAVGGSSISVDDE